MSRSSSQPPLMAHHHQQQQQQVFTMYPNNFSYSGPEPLSDRERHFSDVSRPVIKMESQSQDQQYLGYQPMLTGRNDWNTTSGTPMIQQPMTYRQVQATAATVSSAQGSHNDGYTIHNGTELPNNSLPTRRSEAIVAQGIELNPFGKQPGSEGKNRDLQYQTVHYDKHRHPQRISSQFHSTVPEYYQYPNSTMSLTYENAQRFMSEGTLPNYPVLQEEDEMHHQHHEHPRYPSPPMPTGNMNGYSHQALDVAPEDAIQNLPQLQSPNNEAASPGRSKPIPKPEREVTKNEDGKYVCSWPGCTEETRTFGRKCEWSKHMDKHDRPYKCPADGCEKLPGFTYSGGLLRHEREVHGKHGGPRKQLNCPHLNCKRHTGKGFSRQENLNEHLRRVHTSDDAMPDAAETEEDGDDIKSGLKRKRAPTKGGETDIREEMKKLRAENEELKSSLTAQNAQTAEMMAQIRQLQAAVSHPHPRMPNAPMM